MAFYNNGEAKTRPGVHMRITNRANSIFAPATTAPEPSGIMLLKDRNGLLLKTADGYYLAVKNNKEV